MNERVTRKRALVILLTLTMILSCLGLGGIGNTLCTANAQELATATDAVLTTSTDSEVTVTETTDELYASSVGENEGESFSYENIYNSENFDVSFKLDNKWDTGYNATITITNTSDSVIENWCLTFPLSETISNIWNATVSKTHEDFYVIKNAGWNQDIAVGGSVSFGLTVYEPFTAFPEYYTIIGNQVETKSEDYTIDYKVTEDWGDGYKAEVTITNNKDTAIEDWRLSFTYGDNLITQIWNAVILGNAEGKYEISCETYNQNIAPGASITFGFMVEPGCSGNMMENIRLTEVETDLSDGIAILFGYMDEGSNELVLNTMASMETDRYEFYMSFDDGDFVKIGETVENEFTYAFEDTFAKAEIYAIGYDTYGLPAETNHIFVECTDGVYTVILPDTDGDGLEDVYEIYYGSDVELVDTDGDKLSDYYEVKVSFTSPTQIDTDENGVTDDEEDFDGDNLSTYEEYLANTKVYTDDTDSDNLSDGDELKIYRTNPLLADTDGDELVDGDEIGLNLDPFIIDTDEDGIIDSEEMFQQTYSYVVENSECAVTEVSISLECTGYLQNNTNIESVMDKDVLCSEVIGLVGEPFEIETTSEFNNATLTFKFNTSMLDDVAFENLMFLWYDEENYNFVELETILDINTGSVSINTTHFSKYMVVDKTVWYDAWAEDISYCGEENTKIESVYTVLTIDCSGSMDWNDPITYNNNVSSQYDAMYRKSCYRIDGAMSYIDCMSENDKTAIVMFDDYGWVVAGFTDDKQTLKLALQGVINDGGTNYNIALRKSIDLFKQEIIDDESISTRIVFLTDGQGSCDGKYLSEAKLKEIPIYGIGVGDSVDDGELKNMSHSTNGEYFEADKADQLSELYEKIYILGEMDRTDSDRDLLYDIVETAGIRLINGRVIYTNPNDPDTDNDKLWDGQEVNPIPEYVEHDIEIMGVKIAKKGYAFRLKSDPTRADMDGDGANDNIDATPLRTNEKMSYIFYGENDDWFLGYEAEHRYIDMTKLYGKNTQKIITKDLWHFKDEWGYMGEDKDGKIIYSIDEVHIIYHGSPRSISIGKQGGWLYADTNINEDLFINNYNSNVDITISDLKKKTIKYLNLSSCNNGNLDFFYNNGKTDVYTNMAVVFLEENNIDIVTAWDGSAIYKRIVTDLIDIPFEWSRSSEEFDKWSIYVNGKKRKPEQQITYWKENGVIVCSPSEKHMK